MDSGCRQDSCYVPLREPNRNLHMPSEPLLNLCPTITGIADLRCPLRVENELGGLRQECPAIKKLMPRSKLDRNSIPLRFGQGWSQTMWGLAEIAGADLHAAELPLLLEMVNRLRLASAGAGCCDCQRRQTEGCHSAFRSSAFLHSQGHFRVKSWGIRHAKRNELCTRFAAIRHKRPSCCHPANAVAENRRLASDARAGRVWKSGDMLHARTGLSGGDLDRSGARRQ
jgi:hypothetical protein